MKYIKRLWWLAAIPFIAVAITLTFARDIILGVYDDQGWRFWK